MTYGKKSIGQKAKGLALKAAFMAAVVGFGWQQYGTMDTIEFRVTDKPAKEDDGDYRLVTNIGVINNDNSFLHVKTGTDAEDLQGQAEIGHSYLAKVYSPWPFGLGTRNLLSLAEAPTGPTTTVTLTANGQVIELTVPAEAAGKITVNKVTPQAQPQQGPVPAPAPEAVTPAPAPVIAPPAPGQ